MADETSGEFSSLAELADAAIMNGWCVKPFCTTCGSMEFRKALAKMPRDVVVAGLRIFEEGFISVHRDMVIAILEQVAYFSSERDMLDPLAGTPAGAFLERLIQHEDQKRAAQQENEEFQSTDAVERRRAQRKMDSASKHDLRREQSAETFALILSKFAQMPDRALLREAFLADYRFNLGAVGGVLFGRILSYYRDHQINPSDMAMLDELASRHGGHWSKLRQALIELQP